MAERTAADVAEALRLGKWFVWPWEQIGPDSDLDEWKTAVVVLCEEMRVPVGFIDLEPKSVTVVFNEFAVPGAEDVQDLILKVDRTRWLREST